MVIEHFLKQYPGNPSLMTTERVYTIQALFYRMTELKAVLFFEWSQCSEGCVSLIQRWILMEEM